ncbi:hypothetical protein EK904_000260 [Melospiza melodia maxima]|nr:hypothetical protein EK904_000260 [Melospiza melodia maxima]
MDIKNFRHTQAHPHTSSKNKIWTMFGSSSLTVHKCPNTARGHDSGSVGDPWGHLGSSQPWGRKKVDCLRRISSSLQGSSLGHDVDLQQAGHGVHSVEDAKGQANVHNGRPHGIAIEVQFCVIVKLGPGTERRHDPELWEEMGEQHCVRKPSPSPQTLLPACTHYDIAQQQEHGDLPQELPPPVHLLGGSEGPDEVRSVHGFRARRRAGGQGGASVRHPQGHGVDVHKGEPVEVLLVRLVLAVLLGGLPVEALDDEDVLEGVLGDHEEGIGRCHSPKSWMGETWARATALMSQTFSSCRCGLMLTLTTNLAVWMSAVTDESVHKAHSKLKKNMTEEIFRWLLKVGMRSSSVEECNCNSQICQIFKNGYFWLYPFNIEYSLFASAMVYVMWKNVGRFIDHHSHHIQRLKFRLFRRTFFVGIMLGLIILVSGLGVLILYEVQVNSSTESSKKSQALTMYYIFNIVCLSLMSLVCIGGSVIYRFDKRDMDRHKNPTRTLDVALLMGAALGQYAISYYSIVAIHPNYLGSNKIIQ